MTVLSAMQSAAMRVISRRPPQFFGATNGTFEQEFCDLVNEVAKDIAASHAWQKLIKVHTLTGDGITETFPMPADYDRQLVMSDVQDFDNWAWGYRRVMDINEFLYMRARGFEPAPGVWTIYGGEMQFTPPPSDGTTASYPYISNLIVRDNTDNPKSEFDQNSDTFVLPERLLTLGLVWRWRENKKLDYTGDQDAFVKALSEYAGRDAGSRVYGTRRLGWRGNFSRAYPWTLGPVGP